MSDYIDCEKCDYFNDCLQECNFSYCRYDEELENSNTINLEEYRLSKNEIRLLYLKPVFLVGFGMFLFIVLFLVLFDLTNIVLGIQFIIVLFFAFFSSIFGVFGIIDIREKKTSLVRVDFLGYQILDGEENG